MSGNGDRPGTEITIPRPPGIPVPGNRLANIAEVEASSLFEKQFLVPSADFKDANIHTTYLSRDERIAAATLYAAFMEFDMGEEIDELVAQLDGKRAENGMQNKWAALTHALLYDPMIGEKSSKKNSEAMMEVQKLRASHRYENTKEPESGPS